MEQMKKKRNRISMTAQQQRILLIELDRNAFPSKEYRDKLANDLGLEPKSIQIWFQNQRQRVRKSARMERQHQEYDQRQKSFTGVGGWTSWKPYPITGDKSCITAPPASPRLMYSGPDKSAELNALVDAAVEELARAMPSPALSAKSSVTASPTLSSKSVQKGNSLLRLIPVSMQKSPRFRFKEMVSSKEPSPKMRPLQPRSQPNSGFNGPEI